MIRRMLVRSSLAALACELKPGDGKTKNILLPGPLSPGTYRFYFQEAFGSVTPGAGTDHAFAAFQLTAK